MERSISGFDLMFHQGRRQMIIRGNFTLSVCSWKRVFVTWPQVNRDKIRQLNTMSHDKGCVVFFMGTTYATRPGLLVMSGRAFFPRTTCSVLAICLTVAMVDLIWRKRRKVIHVHRDSKYTMKAFTVILIY